MNSCRRHIVYDLRHSKVICDVTCTLGDRRRRDIIDAMPGAPPDYFRYSAITSLSGGRVGTRYQYVVEAARACNYISTSSHCLCAAVVLCTCGATAIYCFSVLVLLFWTSQLRSRQLLHSPVQFYCGRVCATTFSNSARQEKVC